MIWPCSGHWGNKFQSKRATKLKENLHLYFSNIFSHYSKVFVNVRHKELLEISEILGLHGNDVRKF